MSSLATPTYRSPPPTDAYLPTYTHWQINTYALFCHAHLCPLTAPTYIHLQRLPTAHLPTHIFLSTHPLNWLRAPTYHPLTAPTYAHLHYTCALLYRTYWHPLTYLRLSWSTYTLTLISSYVMSTYRLRTPTDTHLRRLSLTYLHLCSLISRLLTFTYLRRLSLTYLHLRSLITCLLTLTYLPRLSLTYLHIRSLISRPLTHLRLSSLTYALTYIVLYTYWRPLTPTYTHIVTYIFLCTY